MIRIIYFGTTDFSATVLTALAKTNDFKIVGVVTQPARPVGRTHITTASPVKTSAVNLGLPVFEPESLKNFSADLLPPADIFVVFAYGLIIPKHILDLPTYGALNIHPSLLPKYRGPTPVQTALINGETKTGISIIVLDEKMDHGPVLGACAMDIEPHDTTPTLTKKLVEQAIPLVVKLVPEWIHKQLRATPQDHEQASFCKLLSRESGKIDWQKSAEELYNRYRGLTPWPGIWTMWEQKRLKLLAVHISSLAIPPGHIHIENGHLFIGCGKKSLEIQELQLEGKKPLAASAFIQGYKHINEAVLI